VFLLPMTQMHDLLAIAMFVVASITLIVYRLRLQYVVMTLGSEISMFLE